MAKPVHPLAAVFPPLSPAELRGLADSIRRVGLLEDITTLDGGVLDGRNRDQACDLAGVPARYREYAGECGSPLQYVVARNLERRQLDASQRAMVAARLVPLLREERANLPAGRARDRAAEVMGVSGRSVANAQRVQERGTKALREAVQSREVAVSVAADIAELPPGEQAVRLNAARERSAGRRKEEDRAATSAALRKRLGQALALARRLDAAECAYHVEAALRTAPG